MLAECLASIEAQAFRRFEIVVVDDGSTDGTAEYLEESWPQAHVVRLAENAGFCVAANAGIRESLRRQPGGCLLLLNNDMTLAPDFLERLVEAARASDAAMFAPLVLFKGEPDRVYGAGDALSPGGRPESIGFRCPLAGFRAPGRVFGVSAGAALYRAQVFEQVGVFDERFVAYFEDCDLAFRARLAGFGAEFVPDAVAYHIGSASIEGRTWWRTEQCCRNHALLVVKNMPAPLLMRHAPAILAERIHQLRRVWTASRAAFGALRALGHLARTCAATWAALPHALKERRRIQRTRTIAAADLDALLTGDGE